MSKLSSMKLRSKIALGATVAAASIAGGTAAFGYWTASGSGGGSGTVAASNGTVTLVASFPAATLYPGGSVPVTIKAYNTGATNLYVTSVVDGATPIAVSTGCTLADFSLAVTPTTTAAEIPAHTAAGSAIAVATDTLTYANSDVDQSLCKSGTVTLSYTNT
jgi:hypothetical protein